MAHSATDPKRGCIPLIISASGITLKRVRDVRHFGISQQARNNKVNDKLEEEDGDNDDYLLNDDDHQSDTCSHTSVTAGCCHSKTPSTQSTHNHRPMALKASQHRNIAHTSGPRGVQKWNFGYNAPFWGFCMSCSSSNSFQIPFMSYTSP